MALSDATRLADFATDVGAGVTLNSNGLLISAGIITASSFDGNISGFVTAIGSGVNLTGIATAAGFTGNVTGNASGTAGGNGYMIGDVLGISTLGSTSFKNIGRNARLTVAGIGSTSLTLS